MLLALTLAALIACDDPPVHDGDTLRCGAESVRLFGVDAPEVRWGKRAAQPFAEEARQTLFELTRGRVACRFVNRDRYRRYVGKCRSSHSPDLNAALIRSGFAKEYRRYSKGAYGRFEDEAREARRGLWSAAPAP